MRPSIVASGALALCALAFFCAPVAAEEPDATGATNVVSQATADNTAQSQTKTLRMTLEYELSRLALTANSNDSGDDFRYGPNNPCVLKLGAQYGKLGGKLGLISGKADEKYDVKTTCFDVHGFTYFDRFGADLYAQWFRGFYLDDGDAVFPDFALTTVTVNGYWKIAGSCGLNALTTPIVEGKPVAALVYAFASVSRRTIDADGSLVPEGREADFPDLSGMSAFTAVIPSLSAGTIVSAHWGRLYFTPGLSVGFGYPFILAPADARALYSAKFNVKARLGYEGTKYLAGLEVSNDSDAIELKGRDAIQFHSVIANLFVGRKFGIPTKARR